MKAKKDYSEFDKKLLKLIASGRDRASALTLSLQTEAAQLTDRPGDEFRVIDRRLQALRKKGLVATERRGSYAVWSIVKKETA